MERHFFKNRDFFRTKETEEYSDILELFERMIEEFDKRIKTDGKYRKTFELNRNALRALEKEDYKAFPDLYTQLWKKVEDYKITKDKYHSHKGKIFNDDEIKYTGAFQIVHKRTLEDLELPIPPEKEEGKEYEGKYYFKKFLSVSTLFCKAFGFQLYLDATGTGMFKKTGRYGDGERTEYYLFYNRSHIEKMDIGIGKVITDKLSAWVEYYYRSTDVSSKYDVVKTSGDVDYYEKASVMVLRNVKDFGDEGFHRSEEEVESTYVVKQFKLPGENMLLGILSTWNRNNWYPVASAVVMVEKKYYDGIYGKGSAYAFDVENIVNTKTILPRIYYFLYHQSITLESVIEARKKRADGSFLPFAGLDDIPFYSTEAKKLELVRGRYKGLSIIPTRDRNLLVLSELIIHPTGVVELSTKTRNEEGQKDIDNMGFIKFIEVGNDLKGQIFISLKYNFPLHYNSLNHFLEFSLKTPKNPPEFLVGAFAGQSLVTENPVAATVVFERIADDARFEIEKIVINEQGDIDYEGLTNLYNSHQALFRFYQKETDKYTNHIGVGFLRKIFPLGQSMGIRIEPKRQYDVYISIPLSSSRSEKEYNRNVDLVKELRAGLFREFNISPDKVFSSCLDGDERVEYAIFIASQRDSTMEDSLANLESVKVLMLVYPKRMNQGQTSISSSLIEVGFAMGLKKKILIFYDKSEKSNLPKSIMDLYDKQKFTFDTLAEKPFDAMMQSGNNHKRIVDILAYQPSREGGS